MLPPFDTREVHLIRIGQLKHKDEYFLMVLLASLLLWNIPHQPRQHVLIHLYL